MSDHYYSQAPSSRHDYQYFETCLGGQSLRFKTDAGVFSKGRVDYGSRFLLETFIDRVSQAQTILELGAGYGPISLALAAAYPQAQVIGVEINQRALALAQANQDLNKIANVEWLLQDAGQLDLDRDIDHVVTNPPIRAGKQVIQSFVDRAYDLLQPGGSLWLVIQKKQGAPSMLKYMDQVFDNADKLVQDKGYWIIHSMKA